MKKFGPALLLISLIFCAYLPALRNGFVWDDTALILRDPFIRSWRLIPEGFQHFLFTDATASDFYRPIQRLTYTLEYCAFAVNPMPYHLTSILLHAAAAVALWFLSGELLRIFAVEEKARRIACGFAVTAWALHPVHNAAVDYVAGRADPLAALFGFTGLFFALRGERGKRSAAWIVAAVGCFLLSALSKESGLIFPVLWLLFLVLRRRWKALGPWVLASAVIVCIYLSLRLPAEHIPPPTLHEPAPLLVRPIVVARAVAEYAALLVAPVHPHMERDVESRPQGYDENMVTFLAWRELQTLAGILLLGAALTWALRTRNTQPEVFALLCATATTYAPVSGIFPLNATVAEHWLYLPAAFLFLAVGVAVSRWERNRLACRLILALAVLWIAGLGTRTFMRASDWKEQRLFFERTIADGGDTARMFINLAGVEMNAGELAKAKQHLDLALKKEPNHPLAVINEAAVAVKSHDYASAHRWLDLAVTMPLVEAQAHELRVILAQAETGTVDLLRMRLASRTGPSNWPIEKRYIRVLAESGNDGAALAEVHAVLTREPFRAETWELLSELCAKVGKTREAESAKGRAQSYDLHLSLRPPVL